LDLEKILPAAIVVAIMLLVGLPVHEFSHAYVAYRLGDGTAKMFGRLTLNPIVHFDPLGGFLLLVSSLVVVALLPLVGVVALPLVPDDLFVVVSVLLVGTVALALLGGA
jgi:Zn-dependent protease